MPTLYVALPETHKTVLRRCHYAIVQEVAAHLGVEHDAVITMVQGIQGVKTDTRANASIVGASNVPTANGQTRFTATITEDYDEESISASPVSQVETFSIFEDPQVLVRVYPVYVKSQIEVELEYHCGSKTQARRFRDNLRVALAQGRNILHHDVEYDILLPQGVEEFVEDVYELKNRLDPMSLGEYFTSHCSPQIHHLTDLVGIDNAKLAVRERQVRIVGVFDFAGKPPEVQEDAQSNTYKVVMPYRFTLDTPVGMCLQYPPMLCNRPMPAKYLEFVQERKVHTKEEYSRLLSGTRSIVALSHFEAHRQLQQKVQMKLPLNLPLFDDFTTRVGHRGYVVLCSLLTDVDESDRQGLMNLRELDEFYLDEKLLAFWASGESRYAVQPYASLFYLGLHQEGRHHDNNILEIDGQLNVRSKAALSLYRPCRITLSVCLDPTALLPEVMERMKEHKDIYLLYLAELVRGVTNYKAEFVAMRAPEHTFYRSFILMLQDALMKGEHTFIEAFTEIFSRDTRMMHTLASALRAHYPRLYARISQVVDWSAFVYSAQYAPLPLGPENYAMRTVMNFHREAHRMEELPAKQHTKA